MKFSILPNTIIRPLLSTRNKKKIDTRLRRRISKGTISAFRVATLATLSCTQARAPLDLLSQDFSHDQRQIATYYSLEATVLRQKAADVTAQAAAYERLFGHDSGGAQPLCKDIDQESLVRLMRYHSPDNVHQLENKSVRMDPLSQLVVADRRACVSGADLFLRRRVTSEPQKTRTSAHSADSHPDRLARRRAGWKGDTLGPLAQNGAQPNEVV